MKRFYVDLHLCPDLRNDKQVQRMTRKAYQLGYRLIAIPLSETFSRGEIQQLRRVCKEERIEFASRIDLSPKTPSELTKSIRKIRRRFEILAVACRSKDVARQAAKDRRVDMLNFPYYGSRRRFFDKAEAELASNALTCLEIDVKPLLTLEGPARIRLLSSLRREVGIAERFQIPIVVSSGATHELLMRRPQDVAALTTLFDLSPPSSVRAICTDPAAIVRRNREKLDRRFIAPGVRLIRRGKDC